MVVRISVLLAVLASSFASAAEIPKSKIFETESWSLMGERLVDPVSKRTLLVGSLVTAAFTTWDQPMRDQWAHHQQMDERTADAGDFLGTGIPGVGIALGQFYFDDISNADSHARALIGTTIVVSSLKLVVGRKRPGTSQNRHSFPSGHTSTAFATATSLSYAYGWKVALVAYPLATLTALSRVSDDVHWFSDTVGGAILGTTIARAAFLETNSSSNGSSSFWAPVLGPDSAEVLWISEF